MWQYVQADHIAEQYDDHFALNRLFEFDEQILARHFSRPGLVVDFGSGTGRALVGLARRGFRGLAVDLSPAMLRIVAEKARTENLPIHLLQANLVQLDCIRSRSADYGICLFSTLGMIRRRENRHRLLAHARRILKPGGLFVLHVHNLWYNLFDPAGRRWLLRHLPTALLDRRLELGDKFFHYRAIPQMFLHTFTRRELLRALARAGFRIRELIPLDSNRQRPLARPWLFGRLRANGWIVVCE
ncbi:MAG: class I SAM-dependent methyltransferase [Planctomycetota bacterium]